MPEGNGSNWMVYLSGDRVAALDRVTPIFIGLIKSLVADPENRSQFVTLPNDSRSNLFAHCV
ncbi:hypothetical protein B1F69_29350, partial [Pseudomonas syringae]|uniref:hypothetical protein n=1 Tax=Pseudomonas syringae TaxID=317 RepID=UPI0010252546